MGEKKIRIKSKYTRLGLTIFIAGLGLLACYYLLYSTHEVTAIFGTINDILTPFYIGFIMAYLLCPIYNASLRVVYRRNRDRFKNHVRCYTLSRMVATTVSLIVLFALVTGFFMLIIPGLVESIVTLVGEIPVVIDNVTTWLQTSIFENAQLATFLQEGFESVSNKVVEWAQENVLPGAETVLSGVSVGIMGTFGAVIDIFVAVVICVYILNSKEIFQAQAKKLVLATFSKERCDKIFEFANICNGTFGGFITGKIIDSFIIGVLCFIAMSALNLPLAVLISVVVGITNIIPFFGPFIGAIPSGILLLCLDPWAALKFGFMVLVLQQLDGNIIGPKILGKATKLASFWVMFAILVGGGLFGFAGMILGVPTMAVVYTYLSRLINGRLAKREMPTGTEVYENFDKYAIDKEDIFGKEACELDNRAEGPPSSGEQND